MPADAPIPSDPLDRELDGLVAERVKIRQNRYDTARSCRLSVKEAQLFADSDGDVEMLRRLFETGCKPSLIVRIVL